MTPKLRTVPQQRARGERSRRQCRGTASTLHLSARLVFCESDPLVLLLGFSTPAHAQCTDLDGDGDYFEDGCGTAQDCNDADSTIYPGTAETCNGYDDDCHGQ